jgi:hypothetical protein
MKRGDIIFLVLSLVVIAAGTILFLEASAFQKKSKVTEGIVVSWNSTHYIVKYVSDDGVERTYKGTQSKNGKHRVGEHFKVFYLINDPDTSRIFDGKKGGRYTIIFGIVLFSLFLLSYKQRIAKDKSLNKFRINGRKVQAEIIGIEQDANTAVMEKHPYIIKCKWMDPITGREYTDVVEQLWKDTAPFLANHNYIDVYINRDDPGKYLLDTEFLRDIKAY